MADSRDTRQQELARLLLQKARQDLDMTLAGALDLTARLQSKTNGTQAARPPAMERPVRVKVDNTASSFFTIIEVFAEDFPGLLFRITNALF